jgi:ribose transport system permease protein
VLGGTSLAGGVGTMVGTILGALIIGVMNNGMNMLSVPYFYQLIVKGVVILVAVWLDVRSQVRPDLIGRQPCKDHHHRRDPRRDHGGGAG